MNVGDVVLCVIELPDDKYYGVPTPKKGLTYTVSDSTDSCGCGARIKVIELPIGNAPGLEGIFCRHCSNPVTGTKGWSKRRFIKISDNKLNDELMNEKEKDLIITI